MRKIYSFLLLAVMMIAGAQAVSAKTFYFENQKGWTKVNIYYWGGDTTAPGWPGVAMSLVEGSSTTYQYEVTGTPQYVIFNNGSQQTANLEPGEYDYFTYGETGTWSTYGSTPETPVETTYYLKHPWGGSGWSWKQLEKDSDANTYSVTATYGGNGCNWNTSESDTGSTWVANPTLKNNPAVGDECVFTLDPSTSTITITKQGEAGEVTYYLKHPWGGGDWTWKQLEKDGEADTYSVTAAYGGKGCNWNTTASGDGTWVESPTLVDEPATGDDCVFTLDPSAGTITITKKVVTETYTYTVTITGCEDGYVVFGGNNYKNGETFETGSEDPVVTAGTVEGYTAGEVTVDNVAHTVTLAYTEREACDVTFIVLNKTGDAAYLYTGEGSSWTQLTGTWPGTKLAETTTYYNRECLTYTVSVTKGAELHYIINNNSGTKTADLSTGNVNENMTICITLNAYDNVVYSINPLAHVGAPLYATYVCPADIDFSSASVTAYAVETIGDSYVTLSSISAAPKGAAVVLNAEAEGDYELTTTTGVEALSTNLLQASTEDITCDGTQYILAQKDGVVGFYKATTGGTLAAGKGYLVIAGGAKAFYTFGEGEATSIEAVEAIPAGEAIYNLAGQRLAQPAKGVNIIGGKKYIVK